MRTIKIPQFSRGLDRVLTSHLCSPEILLHSTQFKQLFQNEAFHKSVVALTVDETHVIEEWKDEFRKDYGELATLRTLIGMEIPCMGLTGTCSTKTFETVHATLAMGGTQPFYGIDMGSDCPNLTFVVLPMESSATLMADLFAIIPQDIDDRNLFVKTLVYLKTHQQAVELVSFAVFWLKLSFKMLCLHSQQHHLKISKTRL
ncbi:hypothetical protein BDQ17DRAFT_1250949 [Cyathus striatus]|nr:hypothetical protein BDQ17DRAFT_1250949 [Cyathus striatus]